MKSPSSRKQSFPGERIKGQVERKKSGHGYTLHQPQVPGHLRWVMLEQHLTQRHNVLDPSPTRDLPWLPLKLQGKARSETDPCKYLHPDGWLPSVPTTGDISGTAVDTIATHLLSRSHSCSSCLKSYINPVSQTLMLFPFYRWSNWGTEK